MRNPNPDYECPKCCEYISVPIDSENFNTNDFNCPLCDQRLQLDPDAEFENGTWHDLSKLIPHPIEAWTDQSGKEIAGRPE